MSNRVETDSAIPDVSQPIGVTEDGRRVSIDPVWFRHFFDEWSRSGGFSDDSWGNAASIEALQAQIGDIVGIIDALLTETGTEDLAASIEEIRERLRALDATISVQDLVASIEELNNRLRAAMADSSDSANESQIADILQRLNSIESDQASLSSQVSFVQNDAAREIASVNESVQYIEISIPRGSLADAERVAWTADISGVPVSLTDGRVALGLNSSGVLQTNIPNASQIPNLPTSKITSGTFADARIAQTNVTQHEAAINHDALLNFVANEHIDHSTVTVTAGNGLQGGGNLTASFSLALDFTEFDTDDITEGAANLFFTSAEQTKLAGIEAGADVTDATNVAAAGAVMDTDFSTNGIMVRTGSGAYTNRSVVAGSASLTVTNGNGVSGNISIDTVQNIQTTASPTFAAITIGSLTLTFTPITATTPSNFSAAEYYAITTGGGIRYIPLATTTW